MEDSNVRNLDAINAGHFNKHGGSNGILDKKQIESTLVRPRTRWVVEDAFDVAGFAASFTARLVADPSYVDGSKRVTFKAMLLDLDG